MNTIQQLILDVHLGLKQFNSIYYYEVDLCDESKLKEIFSTHKPDYVYHLAAYAAKGLSPFIRNFNYKNNVI